jgi:hypothetical protein
MENIFVLLSMKKQIDRARLVDIEDTTWFLTMNASNRSILKDIDDSIEFAMLSDDDDRGIVLDKVCNILISLKNINRAIKVVTMISDTPQGIYKSLALRAISKALIKTNDFNRATEIASSIPNEECRGHTFNNIFNVFLILENFDGAIAAAERIPLDHEREWFLSEMSRQRHLVNTLFRKTVKFFHVTKYISSSLSPNPEDL